MSRNSYSIATIFEEVTGSFNEHKIIRLDQEFLKGFYLWKEPVIAKLLPLKSQVKCRRCINAIALYAKSKVVQLQMRQQL